MPLVGQSCLPSLFLYIYNHIVKLAVDTVLLGSSGVGWGGSTYRDHVERLVAWCKKTNLLLS